MTIKFKEPVKHQRHQFLPGVPVAVAEENYFVSAGWAEFTDEPAVFSYDDVVVDPLTRFAENGKYVQPSVAEAHIEEHGDDLPPTPQEAEFRSGLVTGEDRG